MVLTPNRPLIGLWCPRTKSNMDDFSVPTDSQVYVDQGFHQVWYQGIAKATVSGVFEVSEPSQYLDTLKSKKSCIPKPRYSRVPNRSVTLTGRDNISGTPCMQVYSGSFSLQHALISNTISWFYLVLVLNGLTL